MNVSCQMYVVLTADVSIHQARFIACVMAAINGQMVPVFPCQINRLLSMDIVKVMVLISL